MNFLKLYHTTCWVPETELLPLCSVLLNDVSLLSSGNPSLVHRIAEYPPINNNGLEALFKRPEFLFWNGTGQSQICKESNAILENMDDDCNISSSSKPCMQIEGQNLQKQLKSRSDNGILLSKQPIFGQEPGGPEFDFQLIRENDSKIKILNSVTLQDFDKGGGLEKTASTATFPNKKDMSRRTKATCSRRRKRKYNHTCTLCSVSFDCKQGLENHQVVHEKNRTPQFECDLCHKKFHWKHNVIGHKAAVHTNKRNFECYICQKTFKVYHGLQKHLETHSKIRKYKCTECDATFHMKRNLKRHEMVHGGKQHSCTLCSSKFRDKYDLAKHKKLQHNENEELHCVVCEAVCKSKHALREHQASHTEEKKYKCKTCGMGFKVKGNMQIHEMSHTNIRNYQCSICSKLFKMKNHLKAHQVVHTGERNYPCNKCDMKFTESGSLKRHQVIHTGVQAFQCDECEKKFARSGELKKHKMRHAGVKPFECSTCKHRFTDKKDLRKHEERKHSRVVTYTAKHVHTCDFCPKKFMSKAGLKGHKERCMQQSGES